MALHVVQTKNLQYNIQVYQKDKIKNKGYFSNVQ